MPCHVPTPRPAAAAFTGEPGATARDAGDAAAPSRPLGITALVDTNATDGDHQLAPRPVRLVRLAGRRTAVAHHRGEKLRLAPHVASPDTSDLEAVRSWVAAAPRPTAIDLFAGAGGLSLGLQQAGFTVLVGADSDRVAAETHHHNIGGLSYDDDLSDPTDLLDRLEAWGIRGVDLVAGGVPCQPFTRAGQSVIRHLVENAPAASSTRGQIYGRASSGSSNACNRGRCCSKTCPTSPPGMTGR